MSCKTTHATCPLAFTTDKYDELQVVIEVQKLSRKANYFKPLFFIVICIPIINPNG
jgi:hypothetical protein